MHFCGKVKDVIAFYDLKFIVVGVPVRKHAMSVANRRRSEPVQRKSNTGNNHNNSKQKRENTKDSPGFNSSRQTSKQMLRKKREVEKRPPVRRKVYMRI